MDAVLTLCRYLPLAKAMKKVVVKVVVEQAMHVVEKKNHWKKVEVEVQRQMMTCHSSLDNTIDNRQQLQQLLRMNCNRPHNHNQTTHCSIDCPCYHHNIHSIVADKVIDP